MLTSNSPEHNNLVFQITITYNFKVADDMHIIIINEKELKVGVQDAEMLSLFTCCFSKKEKTLVDHQSVYS